MLSVSVITHGNAIIPHRIRVNVSQIGNISFN